MLLSAKERILAIRLLEKAAQQPGFAAALGLEWGATLSSFESQSTPTAGADCRETV